MEQQFLQAIDDADSAIRVRYQISSRRNAKWANQRTVPDTYLTAWFLQCGVDRGMKKRLTRTIAITVCLAVTWGVWRFVENHSTNRSDCQKVASSNGGSLTGVRGNTDTENREQPFEEEEPRGFCNCEALAGMPNEFAGAIIDYVNQVHAVIGATRLTRRHYYQPRDAQHQFYPNLANPVFDKDIDVLPVILPRPRSVSLWSQSSKAQKRGWISIDEAVQRPRSPFGCTILFRPGVRSEIPHIFPAFPRGYIPSSGEVQACKKKLVARPEYKDFRLCNDVSASLQFGKIGGAVITSEILTIAPCPENPRLRWTSIRSKDAERHFLAYALVDGNGCLRPDRRDAEGTFVRPLSSSDHPSQSEGHDALLLPTPLIWAPTFDEMLEHRTDLYPCEDWCLDDWFAAEKDACWVIREAADSKPLLESFLLMPAREKSDRPVFFVALFAETEPEQLVKELAALYKVTPDRALKSPETMARLNVLYERIRDFPLNK